MASKRRVVLDQREVERLIYNDLNVMNAYPDHFTDNKAERKLEERLKKILLPGEFVEFNPTQTSALTNRGRLISGKRVAILTGHYSRTEVHYTVEGVRVKLSEHLPNFQMPEIVSELKELGVQLNSIND